MISTESVARQCANKPVQRHQNCNPVKKQHRTCNPVQPVDNLKNLNDEEIVKLSNHSFDLVNKLKKQFPDIFTEDRFNTIRRQILLARARYYYLIRNASSQKESNQMRNALPSTTKRKAALDIPEIIIKTCGLSNVKLNAFRRDNPKMFTDKEWAYFKKRLRNAQSMIHSANYRNRKRIDKTDETTVSTITNSSIINSNEPEEMPEAAAGASEENIAAGLTNEAPCTTGTVSELNTMSITLSDNGLNTYDYNGNIDIDYITQYIVGINPGTLNEDDISFIESAPSIYWANSP